MAAINEPNFIRDALMQVGFPNALATRVSTDVFGSFDDIHRMEVADLDNCSIILAQKLCTTPQEKCNSEAAALTGAIKIGMRTFIKILTAVVSSLLLSGISSMNSLYVFSVSLRATFLPILIIFFSPGLISTDRST